MAVFLCWQSEQIKKGKVPGRRYRYKYKRKDTSKGAVIYLFARGGRGVKLAQAQAQQWRANAE